MYIYIYIYIYIYYVSFINKYLKSYELDIIKKIYIDYKKKIVKDIKIFLNKKKKRIDNIASQKNLSTMKIKILLSIEKMLKNQKNCLIKIVIKIKSIYKMGSENHKILGY